MSDIHRINVALKALRQLGPSQVALNALYRFGLATGHYCRALQTPATSDHLPPAPLFSLPSREHLLQTIGADGLQSLLTEAGEIVAGRVRLFGADPVPLNLEPPAPLAHWTAYETDHHLLSALYPAFSDIKFIWEPARFGWAFVLGRAFHLTGDEQYAAAFWQQFETFQRANLPYLGPNWMSAQEAGLRLMALAWAAQVFATSAHSTPARLATLAAALAAHAGRIPPTLVYARSQNNNHLLTEAAALYTAALALPAHPHAARWRALGRKWLDWCFLHQIDAYGEYVQHSSNYHRLMLQTALWVNALEKEDPSAGNRPTPIRENLALATHWLLSLLDPQTGGVPNLGANDGALVFPLSTASFDDHRPVAQAAARAFLGYSLPAGPWDEMSLWFGLARLESQLEVSRYPGDHIYADRSWGYLRAVRFKSRPSHADQLHFDLWWHGLNIARDAGTYLYNGEPPWDNRLTSTLVHNTVSVDGREQMTRAGRFLYLDWADATRKRYFETGADYLQRVSARTYAYARLGVRHERTVTAVDDDHWLVQDELLNAILPGRDPRMHVYRLHWLLPDWPWRLAESDDRVELTLNSPSGVLALAIRVQPHTPRPALRASLVRAGEALHAAASPDPVRGWVSPTYAVKLPALSLAIEVESSENITLTSEFTFTP